MQDSPKFVKNIQSESLYSLSSCSGHNEGEKALILTGGRRWLHHYPHSGAVESFSITVEPETKVQYEFRADGDHEMSLSFDLKENSELKIICHPKAVNKSRLRLRVCLREGARLEGFVFYRGLGSAEFECQTEQFHAGDRSISNIEVRSACEDKARFKYLGVIKVPHGIRGAQAVQKNQNLVFSPDVHVESEPSMEIEAREVECFHGATMGGIDRDVMNYFLTKGIAESEAREMYISGFLSLSEEGC